MNPNNEVVASREAAEKNLLLNAAHAEAINVDREWADKNRRKLESLKRKQEDDAVMTKACAFASSIDAQMVKAGFKTFKKNESQWRTAVKGSWNISLNDEDGYSRVFFIELVEGVSRSSYRSSYNGELKLKVGGTGISGPALYGIKSASIEKAIARVKDAYEVAMDRIKSAQEAVSAAKTFAPFLKSEIEEAFPNLTWNESSYGMQNGTFNVSYSQYNKAVTLKVNTSNASISAAFSADGKLSNVKMEYINDALKASTDLSAVMEVIARVAA